MFTHARTAAILALGAGIALSGCSYKGPQLDIVVQTTTGVGAQTTTVAHLQHARYTFFVWDDPPSCLSRMQLLGAEGTVLAGETFSHQADVADEGVPFLVQKDLPDGDYRLSVGTGVPRCTWMVEEILNSMSTKETPAPPAEPAPAAPDVTTTVSTATAPIPITAGGLYTVAWSVKAGGATTCQGDMSLTTASGDVEPIHQVSTAGSAVTSDGGTIFLFLTPGVRTVTGAPACPWTVSVSPLMGPNGGGVRGFATPVA